VGSGRLPRFDFTARWTLRGQSGSLGLVSTGTAGYLTLQGTGYRMPHATFTQLESTFSRLGGSSSAPGGGALSRLGIEPLHWLTNPRVAGTEDIGGTPTTHVRASVNVQALLADLDTVVRRAASTGVSGVGTLENGISASTRTEIARRIRDPTVDIWTGTNDHTLRKLSIGFSLPVRGSTSNRVGAVHALTVDFVALYSNLNEPQTITAPRTLRPISELTRRARPVLTGLAAAVGASGSEADRAAGRKGRE